MPAAVSSPAGPRWSSSERVHPGPKVADMTQTNEVWLVRHGETEWSRSGQHTGVTDIALTAAGRAAAKALADTLEGTAFDRVLTSPLQRARRTAEFTGFADAALEPDLVEWDYGDYEGLTSATIRETDPDWTIWTHGAPDGESVAAMSARMDRVLTRLRKHAGRQLLFAHGHSLRALAARWLGQPVGDGRLLRLDTATVSVLGYEHERPVVLRWNC